jgi:protein gp37
MSAWTDINWTERTFNPWIGCTKCSEACDNCYAWTQADVMRRAETWSGRKGLRVWGPQAERYFPGGADWWKVPIRWNRAAKEAGVRIKVFSADMADLFEPYDGPSVEILEERRARMWPLIEETPWLEWQLLTKRPENVLRMVPWGSKWPHNVWVGVTAENQRRADERIPYLVEIPAAVRFLSVEPIRGPVDLSAWSGLLDWVICGAESISKARPFDVAWVRDVRDQCIASGTAFWFKQWGIWQPSRPVGDMVPMQVPTIDGKVKFKDFAVLDGRTWSQFPVYRWNREGRAKTGWERLDPFELEDEPEENSEATAVRHI